LEVERRFNLILIKNRVAKPLKGRTAVKKSYHTINKEGKANEQKLTEFLSPESGAFRRVKALRRPC
jgi:hypothetical protein